MLDFDWKDRISDTAQRTDSGTERKQLVVSVSKAGISCFFNLGNSNFTISSSRTRSCRLWVSACCFADTVQCTIQMEFSLTRPNCSMERYPPLYCLWYLIRVKNYYLPYQTLSCKQPWYTLIAYSCKKTYPASLIYSEIVLAPQ